VSLIINNQRFSAISWLSLTTRLDEGGKSRQLQRTVLFYIFFFKLRLTHTLKRVWSYQRGNQNQYIEEEQTTQWPKEKGQKDKQQSTKHTHKTKARVTRTPLKTGGELGCSGRVSSSCSTSGTHRVNLVTNPVISQEWGKGRKVFTTSGTYPWSFVTQIFHSGQLSHGSDRKTFEVMIST
jgi:hypothetical protein